MRKIVAILATSVGIIVIGLIIWFSLAGPVLVEWHYGINFGSICDPPFVILNPLRNREHERAADEFLGELKNGNLKILDDVISDHERLENIRVRETELEILSWYSAGRTEVSGDAVMQYWIQRKYDAGCHTMHANIGLKRIADHWMVTSYNPSY